MHKKLMKEMQQIKTWLQPSIFYALDQYYGSDFFTRKIIMFQKTSFVLPS
jgi:hypothetical protein